MPAGLQLLPLIGIRSLVELAHDRESADVHSPERNAAHGVIEAGGHLHAHVGPGGADIAAPGCRTIALQAGKTVPGQEEHPFIRIYGTLALIDGHGVHQGIGIEILRGGAQGIGGEQPLEIVHGKAVPEIGFGSVHPPGVNLAAVFGVETLVHLAPEQFPSAGGIGVIERLGMAQPVFQAVLFGIPIHIAGRLEFLVMHGIGIELGPDGNHEAAVESVHIVQHLLRIGITGRIESMAPPLVFFPILPVLDDIVHRNVPSAQFCKGFHQIFLGGIAFPALPEAQHPFGHYRRFSGKLAISPDNAVIGTAPDEIIVQLRLKFVPEGDAFVHRSGRKDPQADIRHVSVGLPFHLQRSGHTLFQMSREFITVGVPGRTPASGHLLLAAHFRALKTGIILDKGIVPGFRSRNGSLVAYFSAVQGNGRQVLENEFVLIVEAVLFLDQDVAVGSLISPGQVQIEDLAELAVGLVGAPSAQGIGVHQNAVTIRGNYHGDTHLGVVLIQLFLPSLVVEFPGLVLSQAIKSLSLAGIELNGRAPGLLSFYFGRGKS